MFRMKKRIRPARMAEYLFLIALVTFTAIPLVYLVNSAFKPLYELYAFPPRIFVRNPTFGNFNELFGMLGSSTVPFTRYFFNSIFITACTVGLSVFVCTLAAFSMVKLRLPFKRVIFDIIIAALMFSAPAVKISSYTIINGLGLTNNYLALILPAAAGSLYFFLVKQNIEQIPDSILESAKIDGCNIISIYLKIIMPLSKPVIATVIVFAFTNSWNDFYSPMLYINQDAMKTLPLALQMLQGGAGQVARSGAMMAAALLTTLPVIVIFVFMQSKVIKTMAFSGIK
ncbi:MAG: carbohydrate ABC transporter permease [Saccharofermentanales bacterium]